MMPNNYYLLMTNTPAKDWLAPLSSIPKAIGRKRDLEIQVPGHFHSVSRTHAQVWYDRLCCWICDAGSTYGTWVNGVRLTPGRNTKINHGDRIILGLLELTLIDETQLKQNVLIDDFEPEQDLEDTFRLMNGVKDLPDPRLLNLPMLTNSERDVVLWVARGLTRPVEIGKMLHRSQHTVRTQLNSIFQKLGVHSRDELVGFLLRGSAAEIDVVA